LNTGFLPQRFIVVRRQDMRYTALMKTISRNAVRLIIFLCPLIAANAQLLQFGGSASLRTIGAEAPRGIYTAEGSISFTSGLNLFSSSSGLWIFTINAGARFDPSPAGDTRFFTELVYWNLICMGAGFTVGANDGSFHLMIGEVLPFGFALISSGCFLPPVVVIYARPTWENGRDFYLDIGIKLKFTIPLNLEDL